MALKDLIATPGEIAADRITKRFRFSGSAYEELHAAVIEAVDSVAAERDAAKEALRDLMARLALDTEEDCRDVARRLEIENGDSLWEAAQKARDALDATSS